MTHSRSKVSSLMLSIKELYQKGALHIILSSFATKFVGMVGSIFVVKILSKADYGVLGYVENIYGYVFIFAGLGLSNATLRYLIIGTPEKRKIYYRYIYRLSLLIDVTLAVSMVIVSGFINYPDDFKAATILVPVIALLLPCQDLLNDGLYSLRATFRSKLYAYCSFAVSGLLVLGRIVGAYAAGTMGVVVSRVLINGCGALFLYFFTRRLFLEPSRGEKLSTQEKKDVKKYSIQYMLTNGLWSLFMLNDVLILGMFSQNSSAVADYKVAYVLPAAISIFSSSIGLFVGPYFTKHENDKAWVRKKFVIAYGCTAAIVGFVALLLGFLARPLIVMLYGEAYENVVGLMRILLVAAFFNAGLRFTTANLLSAMNRIKYNMIISLLGMLLQIILDILLVRQWSAYGVAISSCIVYLFMAISLLAVFYKEFRTKSGGEKAI